MKSKSTKSQAGQAAAAHATANIPDDSIVAPICSIFRKFLKQRGLKFTAERATLLETVMAKDGLFEADQLLLEIRDAGHRVSKATIYRTIKHLVEAGVIREVPLGGKQAHYQMVYGRKPMDYLVNVATDELIPFHCPELLALRERLSAEHGLKAIGHRFLIYALESQAGGFSSSAAPPGSR